MKKITKSFRVDPSLWKEIKIHVAKKGIDISTFLEQSIKSKLKER